MSIALKARSSSLSMVVVACATLLVACAEKPVVTTPGQTATVGGMEITVGDYSVRYLELSDQGTTYEYAQPVLSIPVTLKNAGTSDFVYSPTHDTQQMTEAGTPLLYPDPGPEADLSTASKTPINGVFLQRGRLAEQLSAPRSLKPGESLSDVFLFQVPDASMRNLIFSVPPAMHGGELPVLVRFEFVPRPPEGRKVHAVGEAVTTSRATFTVDGSEIVYVKLTDTVQGAGYSTDPLLKINYTITNTSDEPLRYEPGHRASNDRRAVALHGASRSFGRARFLATTTPDGQLERATVEPGKSVKDFVLFDLPGEEDKAVTFEMPAGLFEAEGLIRVNLPFEYKKPELPKEMQKAAK